MNHLCRLSIRWMGLALIGVLAAGTLQPATGSPPSGETLTKQLEQRQDPAGLELIDDLARGAGENGPTTGRHPIGSQVNGEQSARPSGARGPVLFPRSFAPVLEQLAPQVVEGEMEASSPDSPDDVFIAVYPDAASAEAARPTLEDAGLIPLARVSRTDLIYTGATPDGVASLQATGARILPWNPHRFVDPNIGRTPMASPEAAADPNMKLVASVYRGGDVDLVAARVAEMGGEIQARVGRFVYFSMHVDRLREQIHRLADLPIAALSERGTIEAADEEGASAVQIAGFENGRRPYTDAGIDGSTQIIALTDTGLSLDATVLADGVPGDPDSASATAAGIGHRKVVAYVRAQDLHGNGIGNGDLLTCDGATGVTHGHLVASLAAGNASDLLLDIRSLDGFDTGRDGTQTSQAVDGVAPGARVYFIDDQVGELCTAGDAIELQEPGSMTANLQAARSFGINNEEGLGQKLAIHNLSFSVLGSEASYTVEAQEIDAFLVDNQDYLVITPAGNRGVDEKPVYSGSFGDGNLDFGTVTSPGTAKNVVTVGATAYPNDPLDLADAVVPGKPNAGLEIIARGWSVSMPGLGSGQGPAAFTVKANGATNWRIKPDVLAPGAETLGNQRMFGPTTCSSGDDDQAGPVECQRLNGEGLGGTSYAAGNVAGVTALVRDYFEKGYAPAGQPGGTAYSLSGPELKAALIASAEVMTGNPAWRYLRWASRSRFYSPQHPSRFTPEQGYGRVTLARLLPLSGEPGTPSFIHAESVLVPWGEISRELTVIDPDQELRIVTSWYDLESAQAGYGAQGNLVRDVDLTVTDCGADGACDTADDSVYHGNFFSEDADFNGRLLIRPDLFVCSDDPWTECDPGDFDPIFFCYDPDATCVLEQPAASEDCNGNGLLDRSHFSLPVEPATVAESCDSEARDSNNNSEAVFLSPDPDGDGDRTDTQLRAGSVLRLTLAWTGTSELIPPPRMDAGLVITGGFRGPSAANSVRADRPEYACSDVLALTVLDGSADATEPSVAASVEVISKTAAGLVMDTETGFVFRLVDGADGSGPATGARFASDPMAVTAHFPGSEQDGLLSVEDGGYLEIVYADGISSPSPPAARAFASIRCRPAMEILNISRRGTNRDFDLSGGCDPRGRIDPRGIIFGAVPGRGQNTLGDLFLDAGEDLVYSVAVFNKEEDTDLTDVKATLRACRAGTIESDGACEESVGVQILDGARDLGPILPGSSQTAAFNLQVRPDISFPAQVEMLFTVTAQQQGMTVGFRTVLHHILDADEHDDPALGPAGDGVYRYSTDFPSGGREIRVLAAELYNPTYPGLEAETFIFDDSTLGGPGFLGNSTLLGFDPATGEFSRPVASNGPWTFDLDDEGFGVRRRFDSDAGENLELAQRKVWQWNNTGECGFQSNDPSQADGQGGAGGVWHSGHALSQPGTPPGRTGYDLGCEDYDLPQSDGSTEPFVLDTLSSPVFSRVRVGTDAHGFAYTVAFTRLAMNVQSDIGDESVVFAYELDPDAERSQPVDALDFGWLASDQGQVGFLTGTSIGPYQAFNPNDPHEVSSARVLGLPLQDSGPGQNIAAIHGDGGVGSFFDSNDAHKAPARSLGEVSGIISGRGFSTRPALRGAGGLPLRNRDELLDGFAGGSLTFEDIYGPNEIRTPDQVYPISSANPEILSSRRDRFQANFVAFLREDPRGFQDNPSYGWGLDDVVVEWTESHPVVDHTPCSDPSTWHPDHAGAPSEEPRLAGGCASVSWNRRTIMEPESSLLLTVIDRNAQWGPDGIDQPTGAADNDDQSNDTDGDGFAELEVRVVSDTDFAGEIIRLEQEQYASPVYRAIVGVSASRGLNSATDGVIFAQPSGDGSNPVAVSAVYTDQDINVAGAGAALPCPDNPLMATAFTGFESADVLFVTARVTDEGANADRDGIADDGETVRLDLLIMNQMLTVPWDPLYPWRNPESGDKDPVNLEDVTITLNTSDGTVACVLDGASHYGDLPFGEPLYNPEGDPFRIVIGDAGRVSVNQILRAEFRIGIQGQWTDQDGRVHQVGGFTAPQRFALDLDLDMMGDAAPLLADSACVGGSGAGRACGTDADCPGVTAALVPATCEPLPDYLQAGGESPLAAGVGYFEGFEGAENMAGRNFTSGPWPIHIPDTTFVHSPALNAAGGYLDGGYLGNWLDNFMPGPLSPGAAPGNAPDIPEGSSGVDGSRCQYNDPRGPTKHYRSESGCRPWDGSDWHVYDSKAFSGSRSLRFGVNGVEDLNIDPTWDSYHTNTLAAAFSDIMHVGAGGGALLSIQHIFQAADYRTFGVPFGNTVDRGHLEAQELDPVTGEALRGWIKLHPFKNFYTATGTPPYYGNCIFDSYDDFYDAGAALGHTPGFDPGAVSPAGVRYNEDGISSEDDYFDPNDPLRLLGPSGSCYPEFVFAAMGDYTSTDPADTGAALMGGALGSTGTGVWANSLFSLDEFSGRTIRLRFIFTGIEIAQGAIWSADLFGNRLDGVRGWVLDDVAVSGLLDGPVSWVPDLREPGPDNCPVDPDPGTPGNAAACSEVLAAAGEDTDVGLPGTLVTLDGSGSAADSCVDGLLEYRWSIAGETIRQFSSNPVYTVAPDDTTVYTLDVRCSTDPSCAGSDTMLVHVTGAVEVSGLPETLGTVHREMAAGDQAVRLTWEDLGADVAAFVLGVELDRNGFALRMDPSDDPVARLQAHLCLMDQALPDGGGQVELVEAEISLLPGEVYGYLAQARLERAGLPALSGSLGQGKGEGQAPRFARGGGDPLARDACDLE